MDRLTRGWHRILVSLIPVGLVLVACSGPASVPQTSGAAAAQPEPTNLFQRLKVAESPEDPSDYLTINVEITDAGIQPASLFIPAGKRVQLVLRNRGLSEHHFRIQGLVPRNLLWLAKEETDEEIVLVEKGVVTAEDHSEHHQSAGFVPYRLGSSAGTSLKADEVYASAEAGGKDAVVFTPTNTGTFVVQDPLHPEITGTVTVF